MPEAIRAAAAGRIQAKCYILFTCLERSLNPPLLPFEWERPDAILEMGTGASRLDPTNI